MLSTGSECYKQISKCSYFLVRGTVLAVDPSVGSHSSMPGWAVYRNGRLVSSGVIQLEADAAIWTRLRQLVYELRKLHTQYNPDVLVYENIPAQRYGGGNAGSHASLLKSVGAILSVSGTDHVVGIMPISWHKLARSTYVKSDKNDAEEIAYVCIEEARKQEERKEASGSRKGRTK